MAAKNVLVCSEQYALTNKLSTFDDINEQHRLIIRSDVKSNTWEKLFLKHGKRFHKHKNMQVINNSFGIYQAVISNFGVGILPEYFVNQSNIKALYIFKESMSETPYYLAYQPSYVAQKWATLIKMHIIKNFEYLKSSN